MNNYTSLVAFISALLALIFVSSCGDAELAKKLGAAN